MKSISERMNEFVQYHINGDGECNTVVLCRWADNHKLSTQDKYELAFFFSATYSVLSAIAIYGEKEKLFRSPQKWIEKNKITIVFQSDRKYMRMKDNFLKSVEYWIKNQKDAATFLKSVTEQGRIRLQKAVKEVERWEMYGRFSAFLFLEMFANLIKAPVENTTIDWKHGNTATSGLLNLFARDRDANDFDKTGKLRIPEEMMDKMLCQTLKRIRENGGSDNVTEVETSLCAYRKLYKGSRYNGYYLDRMLEEIQIMKPNYPEISKEVLDIRAELFKDKYLGEKSGWNGIRPKMKKVYLMTGLIT